MHGFSLMIPIVVVIVIMMRYTPTLFDCYSADSGSSSDRRFMDLKDPSVERIRLRGRVLKLVAGP